MNRERLWILAGMAGLLLVAAGIYQFRIRRLPEPSALLQRMDAGLAQLQTVQGRLSLSLNDVALEQEMWLRLPDELRAEIEEGPAPMAGSILVVNRQETWMYTPDLQTAMVASRVDSMETDVDTSIFLTLHEQIRQALAEADTVQVTGWERVARRRALRVEMTWPEDASSIPGTQATVWLDNEYLYPLALETDGGLSMRFRLIQFNLPLEDAYFQFVPPASVQVIRLR